jgi:hypothetical protein
MPRRIDSTDAVELSFSREGHDAQAEGSLASQPQPKPILRAALHLRRVLYRRAARFQPDSLTHERTANRVENFSRVTRLTRGESMRRGAFDESQIFSAATERDLENFVSHMTIAARIEKPPRPAMAGATAKESKTSPHSVASRGGFLRCGFRHAL